MTKGEEAGVTPGPLVSTTTINGPAQPRGDHWESPPELTQGCFRGYVGPPTDKGTPDMRLVKLEVENFKRLTALAITLKDGITELSGPNGSGKSSTIDAVWTLLKGKSVAPAVPIRKGEETCTIRGDFGELIVTRHFRRKSDNDYTTDIKITNPDGASFPAPQKKLDELIGGHMLDPLDFINMDPRKQFDVLRRFVPGVDFEAIEAANRGDYERRTEVNREAEKARAAAQVIDAPVDTPSEPIDETALVEELEQAGEHNTEIEQRRARRERHADGMRDMEIDIADAQNEIKELEAKIQEQRNRIALKTKELAAARKVLEEAPPLPDAIDTTAIKAKIEQARIVNANVRRLDERLRLTKQAQELKTQSEAITARMKKRTADKLAAIAAAQMPVEGIGFGDGVVLLDGVPFAQASRGKQMRTATAISFAMNPELPLVWIRDGSLLDDDSFAEVAEEAAKCNGQVMVETVRAIGSDAIVLQDGHVKAAEAKAPCGLDSSIRQAQDA